MRGLVAEPQKQVKRQSAKGKMQKLKALRPNITMETRDRGFGIEG
jgi:hypothetical protein